MFGITVLLLYMLKIVRALSQTTVAVLLKRPEAGALLGGDLVHES